MGKKNFFGGERAAKKIFWGGAGGQKIFDPKFFLTKNFFDPKFF